MIQVDDDGDVRVVTLDRPARRNALTPEGLDQLQRAVVTAPTPVVHLHGAGDAFCAGADLEVVGEVAEAAEAAEVTGDTGGTEDAGVAADAAGGGPATDQADDGNNDVERFVRRGQRVASAIEDADAIVVAGVDGPARGGGVELALACDVRVATPQATFAEPGVTFGLFGAWGGTVRLPEVVGLGDALDLSLSGRVVDAEEALRMGLVSRIVDDPRTVADELADNDELALRLVKERVRDRSPKEAQEDAEVAAFEELLAARSAEIRTLGRRNRE